MTVTILVEETGVPGENHTPVCKLLSNFIQKIRNALGMGQGRKRQITTSGIVWRVG